MTTTRRGFIFNSGQRLEGCLRRPPQISALDRGCTQAARLPAKLRPEFPVAGAPLPRPQIVPSAPHLNWEPLKCQAEKRPRGNHSGRFALGGSPPGLSEPLQRGGKAPPPPCNKGDLSSLIPTPAVKASPLTPKQCPRIPSARKESEAQASELSHRGLRWGSSLSPGSALPETIQGSVRSTWMDDHCPSRAFRRFQVFPRCAWVLPDPASPRARLRERGRRWGYSGEAGAFGGSAGVEACGKARPSPHVFRGRLAPPPPPQAPTGLSL